MNKFLTLRVWILLIALVLAVIAISPNPWAEGIEIVSIDPSSDAAQNGLSVGQILTSIGDMEITSFQDVSDALAFIAYPSQDVLVQTTDEDVTYSVTNDLGFIVDENLTVIASHVNVTLGSTLLSVNGEEVTNYTTFKDVYDTLIPTKTIRIETDEGLFAYISREVPDITIGEVQKTHLVFGLDFTGGTRVLLQPVSTEEITDDDITMLIDVLGNRLNVYGLSDIQIRSAQDWAGNKFVLVELAGVTQKEVQDLISQQGKFEAKVGDTVVFEGGKESIPYVCRNDGTCSGVRTCDPTASGYQCTFQFSITLGQDGAETFANATQSLDVVPAENGQKYLSKTIDFYLDGQLVDSLQIASSLKGQATTSIVISGPGFGETQSAALEDATINMNKLQTILITGSLPFDLQIVKLDSITSVLGKDFLRNVLLVAVLSFVAVSLVIFLRYRKIKIIFPILLTLASEVLLILGFAAAVGWNLDMVAIAGILAAIGTGVDDQIVIIDQALSGTATSNWQQRLKRAFFIIFAAYATTVAAMIPLWNAGAGLIRGFAVTTIVGVTIGVFITRPAFATIIEKMGLQDEEK